MADEEDPKEYRWETGYERTWCVIFLLYIFTSTERNKRMTFLVVVFVFIVFIVYVYFVVV